MSVPENSIADLFAKDPMSLSSADLDAIITKLRASRSAFNLGNMTVGKAESKKSGAQKSKEAAADLTKDVSLDDLGL